MSEKSERKSHGEIGVKVDVVNSDEERALRKAEKKAKKQAKRDQDAALNADDAKLSKKRKSRDEEEVDVKLHKEKKHKKSRKEAGDNKVEKESKKTSTKGIEGDNDSADEKAARKERKRLKKEKKELESAAATATKKAKTMEVKEVVPTKLKDKRSKKTPQTETAAKPVASADQWNPDALTGDAARKNKFLRLLGAGKGAGIEAAPKKKQSSDQDIQRVESELERQFAAGIRMKHGGMGKRTGLGM